jgi:hypothetical protein
MEVRERRPVHHVCYRSSSGSKDDFVSLYDIAILERMVWKVGEPAVETERLSRGILKYMGNM